MLRCHTAPEPQTGREDRPETHAHAHKHVYLEQSLTSIIYHLDLMVLKAADMYESHNTFTGIGFDVQQTEARFLFS